MAENSPITSYRVMDESMKAYVARQPIFNRKKRVKAYELLFRDGLLNSFPRSHREYATSRLLSDSFMTIGIERLAGGRKAFINFTGDLLTDGIPFMFPADKIVVEVLEDVKIRKEVIEACCELVDEGYEIALDDFNYSPSLEPLFPLASVIKIDFRATPNDLIKLYVEKLSGFSVKFLAEKVETYEEFQTALTMGFDYFQGYFFSKPQVISQKDISPSRLNLLRIMAEVNKEDFKFEELEKLIRRDVSISYKLLRYINSAYFRRLKEISSIKQAIILLGEMGIRRFLSLITMSRLASDKPDELIRTSIIRARLCEQLGKLSPADVDTSELFTLGLFSLIDALLDNHMENVMEDLPLSQSIKAALIERKGKLAGFLELTKAYEAGQWEKVVNLAEGLGISEEKIPEYYLDAVTWADSYAML